MIDSVDATIVWLSYDFIRKPTNLTLPCQPRYIYKYEPPAWCKEKRIVANSYSPSTFTNLPPQQMDAKVRQLPLATSAMAVKMGIQILLMHTNPSRTISNPLIQHDNRLSHKSMTDVWCFRSSALRWKIWALKPRLKPETAGLPSKSRWRSSSSDRRCWRDLDHMVTTWWPWLMRSSDIILLWILWWQAHTNLNFKTQSLRGCTANEMSRFTPHINKYTSDSPPMAFIWMSFMSILLQLWRFHLTLTSAQNAPRCWAVWEIPRVAGPLRAEWLMTSKIWCWFEVISSTEHAECGSVELFRLQRLSYVSKTIETVYGLESLIGCFHCKCYFGESLAAGNLSSAFVQHDTVPGEECIFTRGHRSSRS